MTKQAFEFEPVFSAIMITDYGGNGNVISEKDGGKDIAIIEYHGIGCHAVFSQHPEQLEVVANGEDIERYIADKLRQTVATSGQNGLFLQGSGAKTELSGIAR
jgi:hypothetical protein